MGSAQIDQRTKVYKWTHCNAQGLLSHTQHNVLKKHYEDVLVLLCLIYFINAILIHQREMSRMVLITPATMPANAWLISLAYRLIHDPCADCIWLHGAWFEKSWLTHSMIQYAVCASSLSTSEIFSYEFLRAPVLFTHVASHAEYEPVRSSRILDQRCQNKSDLPCCPDESNMIRPQKLSHLHLWGSRPWTSLELEWEMSECLYFLYQWSLMLYETLWCFDKVPRQPSKTMSKKSCWPQLLHGMAQCVLRMTFSACTIPRSLWLQMGLSENGVYLIGIMIINHWV